MVCIRMLFNLSWEKDMNLFEFIVRFNRGLV